MAGALTNRMGLTRGQEFHLDRLVDYLSAAVDSRLLVDVLEVIIDGMWRDEKLGSNLLVLQPTR